MILSITPSKLKTKRLTAQVRYSDGKERTIHFGYKSGGKTGYTWIDGASEAVRAAYWARHLGNPVEKRLIENLVISPATLAAYILWGKYRNIQSNMEELNRIMKN